MSGHPKIELEGGLKSALAELRRDSSDNLLSVMFLGSRLVNSSPDQHSAADWFIVVRDYARFYRDHKTWISYPPGFVAWLNGRLAPNIIFIPCHNDAGIKAIVMSEDDMDRAMGRDARDHFCKGRLAQRVALIHCRDDAAALQAGNWLAQARIQTLAWVPVFCAPAFSIGDYCAAMMGVSYGGEIRPEKAGRVAEVVERQRDTLRELFEPVLEQGVKSGRLTRVNQDYRLAKPASTADRSHWERYFRRSKRRATMRWAKYVMTFSGWPDYIARKLERRSGIKVEITDRERRWPLILLWPKAIRTYLALRKSKKNDQ